MTFHSHQVIYLLSNHFSSKNFHFTVFLLTNTVDSSSECKQLNELFLSDEQDFSSVTVKTE